jgi:hypothetical protein
MDWWLRLPSLGSYDIGEACINHGLRFRRYQVSKGCLSKDASGIQKISHLAWSIGYMWASSQPCYWDSGGCERLSLG